MSFGIMLFLSLISMIGGNIKKTSLIAIKQPIYSSTDILTISLISIFAFIMLVVLIKKSKSWTEQLLMVLVSAIYGYVNINDLLYGVNIYLYYDFVLFLLDLSLVLSTLYLVIMSILKVKYSDKIHKVKYDKKYKKKIRQALIFEEFNDVVLEKDILEEEVFEEFIYDENSIYLD